MAKRRKGRRTVRGKIAKVIGNSFINYLSDLFIAAMVVMWILDGIYETLIATAVTVSSIYLSLRTGENCYEVSMWSSIGANIAIPLGAGGALWLLKCGVQHAIANRAGKEVRYDFPAVNADGEDDGAEESIFERPVEDERGEEEMEETK